MIAKHEGECRPHPFQDRTYGKGVRVMNPSGEGKAFKGQYRCTVCAPPKDAGKKRGGLYSIDQMVVSRGK